MQDKYNGSSASRCGDSVAGVIVVDEIWVVVRGLTLLHNQKQRRNIDLIETNSKAKDC